VVAAVFSGLVMAVFDVGSGAARARKMRVGISVTDPRAAFPGIREVFPNARILEIPSASPETSRLVLDVAVAENMDASAILELLEANNVAGVRSVALEEARPPG